MKLVSIAMATYNGEKYIRQQLDSIISQSYKNLEIIIVDDCSTDGTIDIIKLYQQKFDFIKCYYNESNLGATKSFERAIALSSGENIVLADQDDIWFPNKVEELLNNIGSNLLIHSDAIVVNDCMDVISTSHFYFAKKDKNKKIFIDYLISNNVTGCTVMFPRKLAKLALPIPNGFYVHDHYLAIIASFFGTVKLLNKPLIYYRQHDFNSIGAARPNFERFITNCKDKAVSYNLLLSLPIFKDNKEITIFRDYRLSLYSGKWCSEYNILKLLFLKNGLKLLVYYALMAGFKNRNISKKIYNYLHGISG